MKVTRFACSFVTILLLPAAVSAQYPARDGTVTNRGPYLLAAADFGVEAA
jgi:hypothetical protein